MYKTAQCRPLFGTAREGANFGLFHFLSPKRKTYMQKILDLQHRGFTTETPTLPPSHNGKFNDSKNCLNCLQEALPSEPVSPKSTQVCDTVWLPDPSFIRYILFL